MVTMLCNKFVLDKLLFKDDSNSIQHNFYLKYTSNSFAVLATLTFQVQSHLAYRNCSVRKPAAASQDLASKSSPMHPL